MDVDMLNEILRHYEKRDDGWAQEFDLTERPKSLRCRLFGVYGQGEGKRGCR